MRRGQSSVEPLLIFTLVAIAAWILVQWRFDDVYAWVGDSLDQLERQEWFQRFVGAMANQ